MSKVSAGFLKMQKGPIQSVQPELKLIREKQSQDPVIQMELDFMTCVETSLNSAGTGKLPTMFRLLLNIRQVLNMEVSV